MVKEAHDSCFPTLHRTVQADLREVDYREVRSGRKREPRGKGERERIGSFSGSLRKLPSLVSADRLSSRLMRLYALSYGLSKNTASPSAVDRERNGSGNLGDQKNGSC